MVSPKEAVKSASTFFEETLPSVGDVRLEEVELSSDEREWQITLSGLLPVPRQTKSQFDFGAELDKVLGSPSERVYKKFSVRRTDNAVLSMKIRAIEPSEQ